MMIFLVLTYYLLLQMSSALGLNATTPAALMAEAVQEAQPLLDVVRDEF